MGVINKSPNIALLFGILSIVTAVVLIFDTPIWLNYIFALFWVITGLLGIFLGLTK